jgi:hypothetical protein
MKNGIRIVVAFVAIVPIGLMAGMWRTQAQAEARQMGETRATMSRGAMASLSMSVGTDCAGSARDASDIVYLLSCSGLEAAVAIPTSAAQACRLVADKGLTVEDAVMSALGLEAGKSDYLLNCEKT